MGPMRRCRRASTAVSTSKTAARSLCCQAPTRCVTGPPGERDRHRPPGVIIQSEQRFSLNDGARFAGSDCATIPLIYARGEGVGANDNAVRFGQDSTVWGHFYTPTGQLNLGNQTDPHGTFWARAINSAFNVDVGYCPPPVPQRRPAPSRSRNTSTATSPERRRRTPPTACTTTARCPGRGNGTPSTELCRPGRTDHHLHRRPGRHHLHHHRGRPAPAAARLTSSTRRPSRPIPRSR